MKPKVRHLAAEPVNAVRHSPKRHRHWLRYSLSLGLAAALVFVTSGLAFAYYQLQGNIKTGDADTLLVDANRPKRVGAAPQPNDPFSGRALNIVLIGSDTRAGDNQAIGGGDIGGQRSDTTILAHISEDRKRAELISFPRDLMVQIPSCKRSDGSSTYSSFGQFNAAFEYGGADGDTTSAAACTIATIEELTNIRVDGFVVVDMSGFEGVINAIGGVELCIPTAIKSQKANLVLDAGVQHLSGKTALKYARARTGDGLGDGSDLKRIERQQKLLGAVSRKILSSEVLTSPPKLYGMLDSITKSVTMTEEYASIPSLVGLGVSLKGLNKDYISFITVPNVAYPADTNRVMPAETKANQLFEAIRNDQPVEGTLAWKAVNKSSTAKASPSESATSGGSGSTPSPNSTVNTEGQSGVVGSDSKNLSQATDDNPFAAKTGGVDVDVCGGNQ